MPMLFFVLGIMALVVAVPFLGTGNTPTRLMPWDDAADIYTYQVETFARAAWSAGRSLGSGSISRTQIALPSGYSDSSTYPHQALSDGSAIWVWSGNPEPEAQRTNKVLEGWTLSNGAQVGIVNGDTIQWRDGSTASRPSSVSKTGLVIRMPLK